MAGGVLVSTSFEIEILTMVGAAHHLDLRLPNAADPLGVVNGRAQETTIIKQWIAEYMSA